MGKNTTILVNKTVSSNFDLRMVMSHILMVKRFPLMNLRSILTSLKKNNLDARYGIETPIQPSVSEGYGDEIPLDITLKKQRQKRYSKTVQSFP